MNCWLVITLCAALHDRPVRNLAIGQLGAAASDTITSRMVQRSPNIWEGNPIMVGLYGHRPSTIEFAGTFIVQDAVGMYFAEKMRRSHRSLVRKLYWLPQTLTIESNGIGAFENIRWMPRRLR